MSASKTPLLRGRISLPSRSDRIRVVQPSEAQLGSLNLYDAQIVTICRRGSFVDRDASSAEGPCVLRVHPISVAGRRQIL